MPTEEGFVDSRVPPVRSITPSCSPHKTNDDLLLDLNKKTLAVFPLFVLLSFSLRGRRKQGKVGDGKEKEV
ncbi:hypothetical protein E2C01_081700 [Portunus trituberculatus]|uniref:Uncharacterized protein n=1 Tax=Portunus trituberculatus TaxID=210409 RepID=A0A5B7IX80_PORTR|nr:hypothetical protein [Portunus trituberculatus]